VNGYYGFWERLLGLPNVNAHNQRITAQFGGSNRRNWIAARDGARMRDMVAQAAPAADLQPTYATVLLGGNDVCRDATALPIFLRMRNSKPVCVPASRLF
jgi:hypothetical protein